MILHDAYAVKVLLADGAIKECLIEAFDKQKLGAPAWKIVFSDICPQTRIYAADNLFQAMIAIRHDLEKENCKLLCAGARRDVYPSAMAIQMSGGEQAYVLRMGRHGQTEDLVDIFAYAEPALVASVAEQETYYKNWLASLL